MRIALLGDVALIGKYDISESNDWKERLSFVKNYLSSFDYVIANLESPLTTITKTFIPKSMHLRSDVMNVEVLKYLGINAVTLANNHVYDYGEKGLKETIAILERNNIEWYGVYGKDLKIREGNSAINMSGFCCLSTQGIALKKGKGVNLLCLDSITQQLKKDREENAYSILSIHWGQVNCSLPSKEQILIAKKILNIKGNCIIHGHHSHCIEGIQKYDRGIIAYSLGDFLFDTCVSINGKFKIQQTEKNLHSYILDVVIEDGLFLDYKLYPVHDTEKGIFYEENQYYIKRVSNQITKCNNETYMDMRKKEFMNDRDQRAGKHDLTWLISRLNYYSILSKLLSWKNNFKYKRIINEFEN